MLPVTPPTCALLSDYHSERDPPTQQRERDRERETEKGKDLKRKRDREGGKIGKRMKETNMRMPGVEPGSQAWEACMIPLHYMRNW